MQTKLTQKEQEQDCHQGTEQYTVAQDKVRPTQYIYIQEGGQRKWRQTGTHQEDITDNEMREVKLNIMHTKQTTITIKQET